MSGGTRHYRVFVTETRTVEVDVSGARDALDAQSTAVRIVEGKAGEGDGRVVKRHPVRREWGTACWMNNPNRLG